MKIQDVPQDHDPSYEGKTKLCYATDDRGDIVAVSTKGWEVESVVKGYAWEVINDELEEIREKLKRGEVSALYYFMKLRLMDRKLLAQNMRVSVLRVWWHSRTKVFNKLPYKWLVRYSECLDIPVDRLRNGI